MALGSGSGPCDRQFCRVNARWSNGQECFPGPTRICNALQQAKKIAEKNIRGILKGCNIRDEVADGQQ